MAKRRINLARLHGEWEANQKGWRDFMLGWGYRPETVPKEFRAAYHRGYVQAEEADRRAREARDCTS